MTEVPTGRTPNGRTSNGRTPNVPVPKRYEIRITGHLAPRWATWFDGMTLTQQDDGTTVIDGPVADQSALHGLLRTLSDLGLPLVSVTPTQPRPSTSDQADRPIR